VQTGSHRSARQPATTTTAPAAAPQPQPQPQPQPLPASTCNPPFYFEGTKKVYKPGCI
jgi:serine/threonine-protein kinase